MSKDDYAESNSDHNYYTEFTNCIAQKFAAKDWRAIVDYVELNDEKIEDIKNSITFDTGMMVFHSYFMLGNYDVVQEMIYGFMEADGNELIGFKLIEFLIDKEILKYSTELINQFNHKYDNKLLTSLLNFKLYLAKREYDNALSIINAYDSSYSYPIDIKEAVSNELLLVARSLYLYDESTEQFIITEKNILDICIRLCKAADSIMSNEKTKSELDFVLSFKKREFDHRNKKVLSVICLEIIGWPYIVIDPQQLNITWKGSIFLVLLLIAAIWVGHRPKWAILREKFSGVRTASEETIDFLVSIKDYFGILNK